MFDKEGLKNRLSEKAIAFWRMEELIALVVALVILGGLVGCSVYWHWWSWVTYLLGGLIGLMLVGTIFSLCTLKKRYRYWLYDYDVRFFYIREGVLTKRFVMLPFEKIQSVTLMEGPLLNVFGLAAVELQGIEKVYRVPALEKQVALTLQQELADLTRQREGVLDETITTTHCV